jgi:hypothetical protein
MLEGHAGPPSERHQSKRLRMATVSVLIVICVLIVGATLCATGLTLLPGARAYTAGVHHPADATSGPNAHASTAQMRQAAKWATAQTRSADPTWSTHLNRPWSGYCEAFAAQAQGFTSEFDSATQDYQWQHSHGRIHPDSNPPPGALVYYSGGPYGHVGISIGNGMEVSTLGDAGQRIPVQLFPIRGFLTAEYLGWANPIGS